MGSLVELARRLRPKIVELAQGLPDEEALLYKELYDEWRSGVAYKQPCKVRRFDKLYKLKNDHTSQPDWPPELVPALWEVIDETHTGTKDDPIPYAGNMALEAGKHYIQNDVVYLCIRDTISPVYHDLALLVGLYVEIANG